MHRWTPVWTSSSSSSSSRWWRCLIFSSSTDCHTFQLRRRDRYSQCKLCRRPAVPHFSVLRPTLLFEMQRRDKPRRKPSIFTGAVLNKVLGIPVVVQRLARWSRQCGFRARFAQGNLDKISTISFSGRVECWVMGFWCILLHFLHSVRMDVSAHFSALDGQQLLVIEDSGGAGVASSFTRVTRHQLLSIIQQNNNNNNTPWPFWLKIATKQRSCVDHG